MKFEFTENDYETAVTLTPETATETAQLLRMVNNSKSEKPDLYFSFSGVNPWGLISVKKFSKMSHKNKGSLSN